MVATVRPASPGGLEALESLAPGDVVKLLAAAVEDDPRAATLDGAVTCVARWGLAKTTLDDVARAAGCSRATVYRQFPGGKAALLDAVVTREVGRLLFACVQLAEDVDDLEEYLVEVIVTASRFLDRHEALSYLLRHEPETLAPWLAFDRLDVVLGVARAVLGPPAARFAEAARAEEVMEWGARMVISYALTPSSTVRLTDRDHARRLVRTYLLPGSQHHPIDLVPPIHIPIPC